MVFRGTKALGVWKSVYFSQKICFWQPFQHLLKTKHFLQKFLQHIILAIFHVFELDDSLKLLVLAKIYMNLSLLKCFYLKYIVLASFLKKNFFCPCRNFCTYFWPQNRQFLLFWGSISCKYGPIKKNCVDYIGQKFVSHFFKIFRKLR